MRGTAAAIAGVGALMTSACGSGPTMGAGLPNGYVAPFPTEPTASITFATDLADTGYTWIGLRQDVSRRNSQSRFLLIFAGATEFEGIPARGWHNSINGQTNEAARTIEFSTRQRLFFNVQAERGDAYCIAAMSFMPEAGARYESRLRGDLTSCSVDVIDAATGVRPPSLKWHQPTY